MAKIVTVYNSSRDAWDPRDMSGIRWQKISEALARLGHQVDIATNEARWSQDPEPIVMGPNLRRVPLRGLAWRSYDVVKTLFNRGFETLTQFGGLGHPFIISKLGSVVGPRDMPGIYFYGEIREQLYDVQVKVHKASHFVTLLSPAAIDLWRQIHGGRPGLLLVPGAADAVIPEPGPNPYPDLDGRKACLFSGNIYDSGAQAEAHRVLVRKLNDVGRALDGSGIRLYFQGVGDTSSLDPAWVTNLGSCSYHQSWNYMQHASAGIVVSAGAFMHNNESTKIYHYLRAGLPVVSESGFPNDHVVRESGLGFLVGGEDMTQLAERIREACARDWNHAAAVRYILEHHTWDCRAKVYHQVIAENLPLRARRGWWPFGPW